MGQPDPAFETALGSENASESAEVELNALHHSLGFRGSWNFDFDLVSDESHLASGFTASDAIRSNLPPVSALRAVQT